MNQQQKKYAVERIISIKNNKLKAIKELMPRFVEKTINVREALKLIRTGKVKPNGKTAPLDAIGCIKLTEVFDFSKHHKPRSGYNNPKYDVSAYEEKCKPIRAEASRIKDKIMLGDAEEALKLIEKFSKMGL